MVGCSRRAASSRQRRSPPHSQPRSRHRSAAVGRLGRGQPRSGGGRSSRWTTLQMMKSMRWKVLQLQHKIFEYQAMAGQPGHVSRPARTRGRLTACRL